MRVVEHLGHVVERAARFAGADWMAVGDAAASFDPLSSQGVPAATLAASGMNALAHAVEALHLTAVEACTQLAEQGLRALGIGEGLATPGAYHLARPGARPGSRHDWAAEAVGVSFP